MTREEQKAVRELKNSIKKMLRPICKSFKYKTASGWAYKVINDYIYILYIDAYPISLGRYISTKISVKPALIDNIFWEVYEMADIAKGQSFSFHIAAAHAPYPLEIEKFETPVATLEDVTLAIEEILRKADDILEQYSKRFLTISSFKSEIYNRKDPISRLNTALCNIAEENYQEALSIAQEELDKGGAGLFARIDENGVTDIYSYVKKYCEERMTK